MKDDIEQLRKFLKKLKGLDKALRVFRKGLEQYNKDLEECPNGKGAVLKTV